MAAGVRPADRRRTTTQLRREFRSLSGTQTKRRGEILRALSGRKVSSAAGGYSALEGL